LKVVLLAGGLGTRLSEETSTRPKPMVEIGGKPILWHIMKTYSHYGFKEFIICCGYKGYLIKEYFNNYFLHTSDVTIDLADNQLTVHSRKAEDWKVTLVDTGENTLTGGRLKRVAPYLENEDCFCFTYGDGLSNLNISALVDYHLKEKRKATLTAVQPPGRFGSLSFERGKVLSFQEKPSGDGKWINGGFFVLQKEVLNLIDGDSCIWEKEPLEKLARDGQLSAFKHSGFWQPMDTLRDKLVLNDLWETDNAPWKVWT
tara:strand:- start:525 stop:1298 length:774 start_codon:yes stop_codon:yes gene_type:complete